MPYLSHNYRHQPRSKFKSFVEAFWFISASAFALLTVLALLGMLSTSRANASADIVVQSSYQNEVIDVTE